MIAFIERRIDLLRFQTDAPAVIILCKDGIGNRPACILHLCKPLRGAVFQGTIPAQAATLARNARANKNAQKSQKLRRLPSVILLEMPPA